MATKSRIWPTTPTHPGEVLADELTARAMSPSDLAGAAHVDHLLIEELLRGSRSINADLAWALERSLEGISARFWMNLQSDYDLGIARLRRENQEG